MVRMRVLSALMLSAVFANMAVAQDATGKATPDREYPTVASALGSMRAKSGVKTSVQSGWTVIEDPSTLSLWSFTPRGHAAYPAAVHRMVVREGNDIFVHSKILCEGPK